MQLISKYIKGIHFQWRWVVVTCSKCVWVVSLKDIIENVLQLLMLFKKKLNESNCKLSKIWVDKGSKFYNRSVKSWLQDVDIEMYSTNNEGKSVVAKIFIRTLTNKIYKHLTSLSKNVYIDKLHEFNVVIRIAQSKWKQLM